MSIGASASAGAGVPLSRLRITITAMTLKASSVNTQARTIPSADFGRFATATTALGTTIGAGRLKVRTGVRTASVA